MNLKYGLEQEYTVTMDSEGKLYVGITLDWDYDKGKVETSMTGFSNTALHKFQHPAPRKFQHPPHPWVATQYGKNNKMIPDNKDMPLIAA